MVKKLPPNLLRTPNAYIDGQVKKIFEKSGFGGIPLWTESGCTIFVHTRTGTIETTKEADLFVQIEFEEVDGVPLIWLEFEIALADDDRHRVSIFLNILDDHAVSCLRALPYQHWIVIHWYNEEREYSGSSAVEWTPENQEKARKVTEQAWEVIQRTGGGDFEEVLNRIKKDSYLS
ncbi:MAG: hypothetical protein GXY92_09775 [Syntrophomonadaceae bacterium]|nr:hypothetical protein [Syntrophomonadaceae bacterium]